GAPKPGITGNFCNYGSRTHLVRLRTVSPKAVICGSVSLCPDMITERFMIFSYNPNCGRKSTSSWKTNGVGTQNERIAILCHQREQFLMSLIAQQILKDRCPPLHLPPGVFPDSSRNVRPS
ncbi:hypothetical protein ALC62_13674, partial [Cyphomyrmex costatus]